MRKIGITTTIPVEVIFAAGCEPVDLNNLFITSKDPSNLILKAERDGFPRTTCSWIKGIYSVALEEGIKEIVGVMEGDCSNTHALAEVLEDKGIKIIPFSFPFSQDYSTLKRNIESLMKFFNVGWEEVLNFKEKLDGVRVKLKAIDELTYKEDKVSGFENHIFLVSSSDFKGDYAKFSEEIDFFIKKAKRRKKFSQKIRLGFIGVPPIIDDIYFQIEKLGARVVYNEVQREFAMIDFCKDIVRQYLNYSYPYSVKWRISKIKREIKKRRIHGIIHYVQAFCFRAIQDKLFKNELGVPVLTIEGDKPSSLDERTKIRLESFIDMLKWREKGL